jgi:NADH:ubiquinone oxidoreductase subunit H
MGDFLTVTSLLLGGAFGGAFDFFLYGVLSHLAGPLLFVFLFIVIVLVRITTPRLRIEAMGRLGWQPMF